MNSNVCLDRLSDGELLLRTGELAVRGRRVEAALIAHMAEVDRRKLYRGEACTSMFAYATQRLRLSESQAYDRITVARASRRFPALLAMIEDGRLTLTAASKLAPHLTPDSADALLARAEQGTRRQVEVLIAEVAPRPDAPSSIRRLPAPRTSGPPRDDVRPTGTPRDPEVRLAGPARVVASAPGRFRVQFTASAELEATIARARALLRHKIPSGDVAAIIEEAMTLLVAKLERTKCGATGRPRKTAPAASASRDVPAPTVRAIWQRDDARCTFVDGQGRRCEAREWLEIHHDVPFGRGGETSVDNLRLLCRSHNALLAEQDFGTALIAQRIAERRQATCGREQLSLLRTA
jgi:hypothetical protein